MALLRIQLGAPWALVAHHLPLAWRERIEAFARSILAPVLTVFIIRRFDRDREVAFWAVSAIFGLISSRGTEPSAAGRRFGSAYLDGDRVALAVELEEKVRDCIGFERRAASIEGSAFDQR